MTRRDINRFFPSQLPLRRQHIKEAVDVLQERVAVSPVNSLLRKRRVEEISRKTGNILNQSSGKLHSLPLKGVFNPLSQESISGWRGARFEGGCWGSIRDNGAAGGRCRYVRFYVNRFRSTTRSDQTQAGGRNQPLPWTEVSNRISMYRLSSFLQLAHLQCVRTGRPSFI